MATQDSFVTFVQQADRLPMPKSPAKRGRGYPRFPRSTVLKGVSDDDRASPSHGSGIVQRFSATDARNGRPVRTVDRAGTLSNASHVGATPERLYEKAREGILHC